MEMMSEITTTGRPFKRGHKNDCLSAPLMKKAKGKKGQR
jgi:hypothetical protein